MENTLLPNPHVGEILKHEFLEELDMTEKDLADAIGLNHSTIERIAQAKAPITADIDLEFINKFIKAKKAIDTEVFSVDANYDEAKSKVVRFVLGGNEGYTNKIKISVRRMARQRWCKKNGLCSMYDLSKLRIIPVMALDA